MKTLAIVNRKGGVGKTVTAVHLSIVLATEHSRRVLLVDADGQATATRSLLPPGEYNTLEQLLVGEESYYENLIYESAFRGLSVLPADDGLRSLEGRRTNREAIRDLADVLDRYAGYDVMVIDCPPALSPACAAAIAASTDVIIHTRLDDPARDLAELAAQIGRLRRICPDVHIAGALPTGWSRCDAVEQGEALLRQRAPCRVFRSRIRRSPKVDAATWTGEPVVSWSPRSAAAQDYRAFAAELLGET